ncbi:hypothetical protein AB0H73_09365 [Streptomyces olivoreticuli]
MSCTEPAPAWLDPGRLRRRFALAAWGLAVPIAGCAVATAITAAVTDDDAALLFYGNAAVMAWAAVTCVARVRTVRARVTSSADSLLKTATGHDGDIRRAADDFELCMVGARSAAGLRILPKKDADTFARDVVREAEAGQLSPTSQSRITLIARALAPRSTRTTEQPPPRAGRASR